MSDKRALAAFWKSAAVGAIALAAAAIWTVKHAGTEAQAVAMALPVRTETPERANLEKTLRLNSWIDADGTVTIVPKVSGTLVSLEAEVGQSVLAGQTLALVDPEPYRLALEQARIAREAARNEFERASKLAESGSVSRQALDQATSQKEAAEAQYDVANLNFGNTRVKAPVSGKIVQRTASEGSLVSPSVPILTMTSAGEPLVVARVPEQYARPFVEGLVTAGTVSVPSAGIDGVSAAIRHIAPYVRSDSRTFEVTCALGGDTRSLLPGMYVRVTFVLDARMNALTLPVSALSGESTLWILDRATMTGRPVDARTPFSDGTRFEVPAEYADAEFIVEGQHFLREGTKVRVLGEPGVTVEGN